MRFLQRRVRIRADCFYRLVENTVARRGGSIANYTGACPPPPPNFAK
jgi:hypothetical protein